MSFHESCQHHACLLRHLFHCGDVDALAARLQKVIDEDYHSVQYDMAPYDWDKIAKQVMGVYEGLLK